jgi:hypothetical protein
MMPAMNNFAANAQVLVLFQGKTGYRQAVIDMAFKLLRKFNFKILAIGHLIFHSFDYAFDYLLYPFVIYKLGFSFGFLVMAMLSAAVCLFISALYDWLKKDWLGIEGVKEIVEEFFRELEDEAGKSWRLRGKKLLSWIFHKNKVGQFVFLSLHFDPLITTIYMRKGHHSYDGFNTRDWTIFWGSVLLSNFWWSSLSIVIITAIKGFVSRVF